MKTLSAALLVILVGVLGGHLPTVSAALAPVGGDIYMSLVDGKVLVKTEDTQEWVPAAINMPLGQADRLWVAEGSRSELRLRGGTVVRLNSRTALEVGAVEDGEIQIFVDKGQVYVHVEEPGGDTLLVETPAAAFMPDRKTTFRIDVIEDDEVSASVFTGVVKAEGPEGDLKLSGGQRLTFVRGSDRTRLETARAADEWETWNRDRDRDQFGPGLGDSRQYLPRELMPYARDLDSNGRWVQIPDYGFVWTPTVVIMRIWAPYRMGRWVWIRGHYVWIPQEPWGWAPHHYGRWVFVRPFGWCWVPPRHKQVYWGPGYVGWIQSSNTVSWVPLAPRDLYYGKGYYGPGSIDTTGVPKPFPTAEGVRPYTNALVANAVTTVHRDTFLTGKPKPLKGWSVNPFLEKRTTYAPPDIKPLKVTAVPVVRDVPTVERPPTYFFSTAPRAMEKRPASMPPKGANDGKGPSTLGPSPERSKSTAAPPPPTPPPRVGQPSPKSQQQAPKTPPATGRPGSASPDLQDREDRGSKGR